jgi:TctA family transporter
MEQGQWMTSTAISIVFFIIRIIEIKFILKEDILFKQMIRDTILVFISSILGMFILTQVNTDVSSKIPAVFTGKPDF